MASTVWMYEGWMAGRGCGVPLGEPLLILQCCSHAGCEKPVYVNDQGVASPCCGRGHLKIFQSGGKMPQGGVPHGVTDPGLEWLDHNSREFKSMHKQFTDSWKHDYPSREVIGVARVWNTRLFTR